MKLIAQLVVSLLVLWLAFAGVKSALRSHTTAAPAESSATGRPADISTAAGRQNVIDGVNADVARFQDEARRARERADGP